MPDGTKRDEDVDDLVETLYEHLEATEELPVSREATGWLGEAQAVARDAVRAGSIDVVRERVRQVRELLRHVEDPGNPEVDERVIAARDAAAEIETRLADGDES